MSRDPDAASLDHLLLDHHDSKALEQAPAQLAALRAEAAAALCGLGRHEEVMEELGRIDKGTSSVAYLLPLDERPRHALASRSGSGSYGDRKLNAARSSGTRAPYSPRHLRTPPRRT